MRNRSPKGPLAQEPEWEALYEAGSAATAKADAVVLRMMLGLATDAEIRDAFNADTANPYVDLRSLTTQCMLANRWDLIG